jgi:hypothetical protein
MSSKQVRAAALSFAAMIVSSGTAGAQAGDVERGQAPNQAAVSVSGTSTLVGEAAPGTSTLEGAIVHVRDNVLLTVETSTDARASGRALINVNIDAYPDADGTPGATQVRFGSMRLVNDDGAWAGRFAGSFANGGFVQTYWLQGEGAFEGWSYVVTAGGNGQVWRSQGLIFPGRLPPLGAGPRLPIDGLERDRPTASAPGAEQGRAQSLSAAATIA